jgi:hypothetical protein
LNSTPKATPFKSSKLTSHVLVPPVIALIVSLARIVQAAIAQAVIVRAAHVPLAQTAKLISH